VVIFTWISRDKQIESVARVMCKRYLDNGFYNTPESRKWLQKRIDTEWRDWIADAELAVDTMTTLHAAQMEK
jgi:hypothetical protein